nr:hypothetical protein X990_5786 [Burkholderia pseudomallei MSHR4868]
MGRGFAEALAASRDGQPPLLGLTSGARRAHDAHRARYASSLPPSSDMNARMNTSAPQPQTAFATKPTTSGGSMLPAGQMPRNGSIANTRAAVSTMPPNTSDGTHGAARSGDTRSSHAIRIAQHALMIAFATNSGMPSGANGAVEKPVASMRPAVCKSASVASRKKRAARKPDRNGRITFCIESAT